MLQDVSQQDVSQAMNVDNDPIVIAFAADSSYAMPLAAAICSVLRNLDGDQTVAIYVLDGGIKPSQKRRIEQLRQIRPVRIEWISPSETVFAQLPVSEKYPIPIYYRLLLPQILPEWCKKVIYLDTDVVANADLTPLWNSNIGERYLLAVQDDRCPYVSMAGGLKNCPQFKNSTSDKYFNTGVLLINLERWRADNIARQAIEFLKRNAEFVKFPDQDALNAVLIGKWGELEPQWNQMRAIHLVSSWRESPYSEAAFHNALHYPKIVHFTTLPKPWMSGCKHPEKHLFFRYLDQTAWSGWRNTTWRRVWQKLITQVQQISSFKKQPLPASGASPRNHRSPSVIDQQTAHQPTVEPRL